MRVELLFHERRAHTAFSYAQLLRNTYGADAHKTCGSVWLSESNRVR